MNDYCNVYYTNAPYSVAGVPSSEEKIISGRVAVHGILAYVKGPGSANVMDSRPLYLSGSAGGDPLFKFVFPDFVNARILGNYPFNIGGDGILFEDGVYFGADTTAMDGSSTNTTMITLLIYFTGGALT
jgi:hypothetical protein